MAGIKDWFSPKSHAGGQSVSLYEHTKKWDKRLGDPIADVYAVVARGNNAVLIVADGCNWGVKPRLAAKCAVHACMSHLNAKLYSDEALDTTHEVFHALLRSFEEAHQSILRHGGTTTTLTAAVVCPLQENEDGYRWCVCVVSVGDSQAYLYKAATGLVYEVTRAVHQGVTREMRDCGGSLGMSRGDDPDLRNLLCTFSPLEEGDIVFLSTDGLSDNFDPVVQRIAETPESVEPSISSLPILNQEERDTHALRALSQTINKAGPIAGVTDLITRLISHVVTVTDTKRTYLEKANETTEVITSKEKMQLDRTIRTTLKQLPGKLDHCTIGGYKVGVYPVEDKEKSSNGASE